MTQSNHTPPAGLILLSQTAISGISHAEMDRIARQTYGPCPTRTVELDLADLARRAIASDDWSAARRAVQERFDDDLAPLRASLPDYRVVYFGSAPVPLALQLGALLGTGATIHVIPRHHQQGTWAWHTAHPPARLRPVELPEYRDRTEGVAIVRVSTSHQIDPLLTRHTVGEVPLLDIDIALDNPREDAFSNLAEMAHVASQFRAALNLIGDHFPGVYRIHLFASVQPGMALLLGAQVSAMHPEIQTYQYARNEVSGPYHTPAVLLNSRQQPVRRPPDAQERQRAADDRQRLADDLERMAGLAHHRPDANSWLHEVLPGADLSDARAALTGHWTHLPRLGATPLSKTRVDLDTHDVDDSFVLDPGSLTWRFDDAWLAQLGARLPDDDPRRRALRLFLLHEAVHRGPQSLTRATSRGMGRFARVLEAMDYQADLWAMLYERALTGLQSPRRIAEPAAYFRQLILLATESMWAFDDHGETLPHIQVRRLNRYLNWYWQFLRLELASHARGTAALGLHQVLRILAHRPSIELAGPALRVRAERLYFALDSAHVDTPELAVYHQGKLHRLGHTVAFDIAALLDAVRSCHSERVLDILRAAATPILS